MSTTRPTPLTAPLDGGLLIEASAGTGKTHTLSTLAARLVVEAGHGIEDLLIVTFTAAATGELRTRIWQTLHAARNAVRADSAVGGGQGRELAAHWRDAGIGHAEARLTRAIRDFDRAAITTIHGFCQRALAEFALHARLPFAFRVSGDAALEVESATRDFWRRHMVQEPVALLEYARQQKFVLDEASAWAGRHHANTGVIRPAAVPRGVVPASQPEREEWLHAFRATRDAWVDRAERRTFDEVLERYTWKKPGKDEAVSKTVIEALDNNDAGLLSLKDAGYFAPTSLAAKLFKKNPPPDTRLFARFERLGRAASELGDSWLSGRRRGLLEGARETLDHATREARRLSFDALLTQLHRALVGAGGEALAARMRTRYPVALIDEFQDTDRLQARIFENIYAGGRAHWKLYCQLGEALGIRAEEMWRTEYCAGALAFKAFMSEICGRSFLEGVSAHMLAGEAPVPVEGMSRAEALRKHYGLDDQALEFFAVHQEADDDHASVGVNLLAEFAPTEADRRLVVRTVEDTLDMFLFMYDDIHEQVKKAA